MITVDHRGTPDHS